MANTTAIEGAVLSADHNQAYGYRQPSPTNLTPTFSSNNPFRNRATSPSQTSPQFQPPRTNMSKNPFLDASEVGTSSNTMNEQRNGTTSNANMAADIFNDLSLLDRQPTNSGPPPPPYSNGAPQRPGNLPATSSSRPLAADGRREAPPRPPRAPPSPSKRDAPRQRPRGMSESSVIDEKERRERRERERERERERGPRPVRTESEERRRRERRREREERHRQEKEKVRKGERSGGDRPGKKPQGLDIIDKLDVTGIYGSGLFHHDGPFDACNPHRNKAKSRRPAPMQAFPADSANMQLGGAGPLRSKIDLDKFHGRGEEGFAEYSTTKKADTANYINPTEKVEQIHGNESYGLGTSTFLEGAPASKSALQRRESEDQNMMAQNGLGGGGLSRKKSLAQRLRGMSSSRRQGSGDMRSPDARYHEAFDSPAPQIGQKSISAGGPARARYTKENEINPFDNEYDSAFDKKTAQIRIAEQERPSAGRARAPSSPKEVMLTRTISSDIPRRGSNEEQKPSGGGLLNRMRSIKGGRRSRPERRDT